MSVYEEMLQWQAMAVRTHGHHDSDVTSSSGKLDGCDRFRLTDVGLCRKMLSKSSAAGVRLVADGPKLCNKPRLAADEKAS